MLIKDSRFCVQEIKVNFLVYRNIIKTKFSRSRRKKSYKEYGIFFHAMIISVSSF